MQRCIDELHALTIETARTLLRERGYGMLCRFDHIHAMTDSGELHICLIDELASMNASQFLACLDDTLRQSLKYKLPFFTEQRKTNVYE